MQFNKYNDGGEKVTIGSFASSSSSSTSSTTNRGETTNNYTVNINRELWGNQDNGNTDIDGDIKAEGNIYAYAFDESSEQDDYEGEDVERYTSSQSGVIYAETLIKSGKDIEAPEIYATEHLYVPDPQTSEKTDIIELLGDYDERITTNTTNITTLNGKVATNTTNIANLTTQVTNNTTNITNLAVDVETNTINIETNANNIASLSTQVTSNTTQINTVKRNVTNLTSSVGQNKTAIGNLNSTINDLSERIETLEAGGGTGSGGGSIDEATALQVSKNTTAITTIKADLSALRNDVDNGLADVATDITDLTERVEALEAGGGSADVSGLQTQITTNRTNITRNTTNIARNKTDITNLTARVSALENADGVDLSEIESNIETNANDIASLKSRVSALEAGGTGGGGSVDLTEIEQNITNITTDITNINNTINNNSTDITNITARVEALENADGVDLTEIEQNIATNTENIETNTTAIGANTTNIESILTRLADMEKILNYGDYSHPIVLFSGHLRKLSTGNTYVTDGIYNSKMTVAVSGYENGLLTFIVSGNANYKVNVLSCSATQFKSSDTNDLTKTSIGGRGDGAHWFECRVDADYNTTKVYIREFHNANSDNDSWSTSNWNSNGGVNEVYLTLVGYMTPPSV